MLLLLGLLPSDASATCSPRIMGTTFLLGPAQGTCSHGVRLTAREEFALKWAILPRYYVPIFRNIQFLCL